MTLPSSIRLPVRVKHLIKQGMLHGGTFLWLTCFLCYNPPQPSVSKSFRYKGRRWLNKWKTWFQNIVLKECRSTEKLWKLTSVSSSDKPPQVLTLQNKNLTSIFFLHLMSEIKGEFFFFFPKITKSWSTYMQNLFTFLVLLWRTLEVRQNCQHFTVITARN